MNQSFNPYHEFLGLDPQLKAPTYYQLLGLESRDVDAARIVAAAEQALARVRGCRPGPQAAAWATLLDELAAAKECLRDPARKAAYDAALHPAAASPAAARSDHQLGGTSAATPATARRPGPRDETTRTVPTVARNPLPPTGVRILEGIPATAGSTTTAPTAPQPPPAAPAAADQAVRDTPAVPTILVPEPVASGPVNAHVAPPTPERTSSVPLAASLAAFFAVLTLIMLTVALRDPDAGSPRAAPSPPPPVESPSTPDSTPPRPASDTAPTPPRSNPTPAVPAAPATPPPRPTTPVDPPAAPAPEPASPDSTAPEPAPTEADARPPSPPATGQVNPQLQQAFQLLTERRFAEADRVLEQAAQAPLPADQAARVARLRLLGQRAAEFWRTAGGLSQRLLPAEEIVVSDAGQRVMVVEASRQSLTVRHEGRNLTFTPETLPPGLAVAIVRAKLGELDATQLVLLGACYATLADRQPEHVAQARRCWDQAQAGGAAVDDLLAALDDTLTPE